MSSFSSLFARDVLFFYVSLSKVLGIHYLSIIIQNILRQLKEKGKWLMNGLFLIFSFDNVIKHVLWIRIHPKPQGLCGEQSPYWAYRVHMGEQTHILMEILIQRALGRGGKQ